MTDWLAMAPTLVIAAAVLIVPGLPAALLLRLRGMLLLGGAIVISLASVGAASLLAPIIGLSWSMLPVLIVAAAITVIAWLLRMAGRRTAEPVRAASSPGVWIGVGAAAAAWIVLLVVGIASPTHPTQLYDGLFHLNAVEFIVDHGDASPFHMTMVLPGATTSFYPTLWHALVALIVPFSTVVAGTNVMTVAVIAVVWPIALATLAGVLFPKSRTAAVWTPLVALGFSVFPLGFLNWGVLYPNLIGMLQIPLVLAFTILACVRVLGWPQRLGLVLIAIAAMGSTALGHPSALLGAIALLVPFAAWRGWRIAVAGSRRTRILTSIIGLAALVGLVLVWRAANVTTHEWLPASTLGQALGEVMFVSPVGRATGLLVGPLALIGIWTLVRARRWWILGSYAVAVVLFLASTWLPILSLRSSIVGVWYDDTTRVGAMLAMLAIPLAGLGAAVVWEWLQEQRERGRTRRAIAIMIVIVVLAATHLHAVYNDVKYMRNVSFRFDEHSQGLSKEEANLFAQAGRILGPDDLVIGDPLTGAALLYAYTGRDVVFPHVTGKYGDDAATLARSLNTGSPEVCAAIDRLGVTYVLDFGDRELFENHYTTYDGLHDLAGSSILTEVMAVGDDATLYEITGCR